MRQLKRNGKPKLKFRGLQNWRPREHS